MLGCKGTAGRFDEAAGPGAGLMMVPSECGSCIGVCCPAIRGVTLPLPPPPAAADADARREKDGGSSGVGDFSGVMSGDESAATEEKASSSIFSASA